MANLVHIELSALDPGMSVVVGQHEFGRRRARSPRRCAVTANVLLRGARLTTSW
jgi:hypothetical protein